MTCSRREALLGLAGLGAAAAVGGCCGPVVAGEPSRFNDNERQALEAAIDRLLPGAKDAGALAFIDYWLDHAPFEVVERTLVTGAQQLDRLAQERGESRYAALSTDAQDDILRLMSVGKVSVGKFDGERFFRQLLELVLESYLGHPKYGGNRERAGWRFIGLPDGLRSCWWNPHGLSTVVDPQGELPGES